MNKIKVVFNNESNKYFEDRWVRIDKEADDKDYKNYQIYLDNYEKLQSVTEVLTTKEREATYQLSGYAVPEKKINLSLYEKRVVNGQTQLYYNVKQYNTYRENSYERFF